ncbi:MAG: cytochrome c [Gammaproteobacteria bacterium]|nr:MAG: cytochrome c [Gammaproteobacteria bacterium]
MDMTINRAMRSAAVLALLATWPMFAAAADESQVRLRDAPGRTLVEANCVMCHSLDYIPMNSVFLDRAGWQKIVDKMVSVMGAPIRPADVPPIVDYLVVAYGR